MVKTWRSLSAVEREGIHYLRQIVFQMNFKGREMEENAGNLQKDLYRFSRAKHVSLQYKTIFYSSEVLWGRAGWRMTI